jgi:hypothetical protein
MSSSSSQGVGQVGGYDLSLEKESDPAKLASAIESFYKNDNAVKAQLAYHWERNHLMLDGQQWLVYDQNSQGGGVWKRLQPSPLNEYIPRPVTNYMYDAYQTLKSYLLKNKPRISVRPNTQSQRDKSAAKLAELVSETNWERLREQVNFEYAASCLLTYGTVFKKDFWDSSYQYGTVKVPRMEQRPVTDPNTGQPTGGTEEVQATDPETGDLLFDELPLGDITTQIVEPYRISMDPHAAMTHEARWIMESSIRPLSWIMENYDKQEEGYTGRASEVKEEKALPNSLRRFYQLRTSSGVRGAINTTVGLGTFGSAEMISDAAIVKEYYERPTAQNPKGRLIVVANGIPLYVGKSPYEGPELGDWHPYSECRWEMVPGRFWGKGPFDDAVEIQRKINSIDSITILTRKTMAVPQKLIPHNSGIAPGQWTGQPGQEVFYRAGASGERPENLPPVGVDNQVFVERKQCVEDFKNITGAVDILKGDRPPGVTAASALSLLFEVGTGKLYPVLDRWKMFVEQSQKKQLRIISKRYSEPRPQFINMLLMKNKELTADQVEHFIGSDLYDNCNVIIEASSSIPKLKAAEHALLIELSSMGVLGLENPANRKEFLSRFGINGFDASYSKDVKRAEWENDLLDNLVHSPDNQPVVLTTDDHDVHTTVHKERTKEPAFMSLPEEVQQAYFMHIQEHDNMKAQAEQEAMLKAAMMGQPGPEPAANPMQTGNPEVKGSNMTEDTKKALMPDIMGPFNLGQ